jgi:hypothetical protein
VWHTPFFYFFLFCLKHFHWAYCWQIYFKSHALNIVVLSFTLYSVKFFHYHFVNNTKDERKTPKRHDDHLMDFSIVLKLSVKSPPSAFTPYPLLLSPLIPLFQ